MALCPRERLRVCARAPVCVSVCACVRDECVRVREKISGRDEMDASVAMRRWRGEGPLWPGESRCFCWSAMADALATGGALALRLPWYRATVPGPHRARAADERPNHHTLKAALRERREVCAAQLLFQEAQSQRRVSCRRGRSRVY